MKTLNATNSVDAWMVGHADGFRGRDRRPTNEFGDDYESGYAKGQRLRSEAPPKVLAMLERIAK